MVQIGLAIGWARFKASLTEFFPDIGHLMLLGCSKELNILGSSDLYVEVGLLDLSKNNKQIWQEILSISGGCALLDSR